MSGGRWTSFVTRSRAVESFASLPWSMTSRAKRRIAKLTTVLPRSVSWALWKNWWRRAACLGPSWWAMGVGVYKQGARSVAHQQWVQLQFIRPAKPVENAYIEILNGQLRDECLNQHYFLSLREAQRVIEEWRVHYNTERPHSGLRGLTPAEFVTEKEPQKKKPFTVNCQPKRGPVLGQGSN